MFSMLQAACTSLVFGYWYSDASTGPFRRDCFRLMLTQRCCLAEVTRDRSVGGNGLLSWFFPFPSRAGLAVMQIRLFLSHHGSIGNHRHKTDGKDHVSQYLTACCFANQ